MIDELSASEGIFTNSLADKLCAMVETHEGRPSSRVKDLVDVSIYATSVDIDGSDLCKQVRTEAAVRKIALPEMFSVPHESIPTLCQPRRQTVLLRLALAFDS